MANISDQFASDLMAHAVDLARFEAHEQQVILTMFKDLQAELIDLLRRRDLTEPSRTAFQLRRADALLAYVTPIITSAYRTMATTLRADLRSLAVAEATMIRDLGAEIVVDTLFSVGVPEATLKVMVNDLHIAGKPLQEWWSKQATTTRERYNDTIRAGILKGDSTSDIVRTLRGTRERRYQDGVFTRSATDVQTLVRTSVNSVSSAARLEVLQANEDVLKGWEWLTALDSQVCRVYCAPLSGQAWTFGGQRMPGTTVAYVGLPPRHP